MHIYFIMRKTPILSKKKKICMHIYFNMRKTPILSKKINMHAYLIKYAQKH